MLDQGNWNTIIYALGAFALLAAWYLIFGRKRRQLVEMYRPSVQEDARVVLEHHEMGRIVPLSVNGKMPVIFERNGKEGIYLKIGINVVELCFEYAIKEGEDEPKRSERETKEIEARPGCRYSIRYDETEKRFLFEEQY